MILYATLPTDPNAKNDNDDNALHVACKNSSDEDISELVKLLVERYRQSPCVCSHGCGLCPCTCSYALIIPL